MENKKNILKLIVKVIVIFLIFEIFINTIGSLLASTLWKSLNYGKYTRYFISETVVLLCSLVILTIEKKWYIFKKQKISFFKSVLKCIPIIVLSCLVFIVNARELINSNINYSNLASLIFYTIAIGLFEEIFFRGIIEEELLQNIGDTKKGILFSILASGIIFGSIHLTNIFMGQDVLTTIMQFIQTTSIGILFGTIYYLTKNIWALAFLHGFYDFSVLLSEVNLTTSCGYTDNLPTSLTASSIFASIIISLIYLFYSIILLKKESGKEYKNYNKKIIFLIIIYLIANSLFAMFIPGKLDDYYICPKYEEKTIKLIETHYYGYDNYYYNYKDSVLHIYKKNNQAIIKDEQNNKTIDINIKNVERVVVIDDNILIIASNNTNYKLYYNKLTDLENINNFISFDIPYSIALGYLLDASTNIKYPMIKSSVNDIFIIEDNKLYKVKES